MRSCPRHGGVSHRQKYRMCLGTLFPVFFGDNLTMIEAHVVRRRRGNIPCDLVQPSPGRWSAAHNGSRLTDWLFVSWAIPDVYVRSRIIITKRNQSCCNAPDVSRTPHRAVGRDECRVAILDVVTSLHRPVLRAISRNLLMHNSPYFIRSI